mmetsp:Transcript_19894/g.48357  ORF Transcript_19894/g.48357 Transcript_19894/m.48357 type:complete len:103 (-) Transcript_19894:170-478(-)
MPHGLSQIGFGHRLHFFQHRSRNFLWGKLLGLASRLHLQHWATSLVDHFEWKVLHVPLHGLVFESPADQPLHVVKRVVRVLQPQVLGCLANKALAIRGVSHH